MILNERKIEILLINETFKRKDKFRLTNYYINRTTICAKKEIEHRIGSIPNLQFTEITGIYIPTDSQKNRWFGV